MVKIYDLKVISTRSFLPLVTLWPSVSPQKSLIYSLSFQYSGLFFPPHTISSCNLSAPENCPLSKGIVSLLLLHPCKSKSRIKVKYDKITRSYLFWWLSFGKESACNAGFNPWVRKIPWRRKQLPTPAFLPGETHGQRSLVDYSPKGHKESEKDLVAKPPPPLVVLYSARFLKQLK